MDEKLRHFSCPVAEPTRGVLELQKSSEEIKILALFFNICKIYFKCFQRACKVDHLPPTRNREDLRMSTWMKNIETQDESFFGPRTVYYLH
jgi:hypothetical protein